MTDRRVAIVVPLTLALLLGDGDGVRSNVRPQSLSQDCGKLQLSEFLPEPRDVDWNGDGSLDSGDEWIEIYNGGDTACDLQGWALDDADDTNSSAPYVITDTLSIDPHGYLVFYGSETGISLNELGDCVRLVPPTAEPTASEEHYCYSGSVVVLDRSCCRTAGGVSWECPCSGPPSPGRPNDEWYECYLPLVSRGW